MLRVAITGSTGLIGSRIQELLYHDVEFIPLLQKQVDITNRKQTMNFIQDIDFDIFLHLAGYTAVDQAEKEKDTAWKINVGGTKNAFDAVAKRGKNFIYISTDFVFDGKKPPYYEDSSPHPIGWYGKTKYEGEKAVKGKGMIVRIAYPYRASFEPKKDFVRAVKSYLEEGRPLQMIHDTLITPTFIDDIAYALQHLLKNFSPETYHIVGASSLSPYEAGQLIAKHFKLNKELIQKTTYDRFYKDNDIRPRQSVIQTKKNDFYPMKTLEEGLRILLQQM